MQSEFKTKFFIFPRNMLEVFILILMVPMIMSFIPLIMYINYRKNNTPNSINLKEAMQNGTPGEITAVLLLIGFFFFGVTIFWIIGLIGTIRLIWIEVPLLILYTFFRLFSEITSQIHKRVF